MMYITTEIGTKQKLSDRSLARKEKGILEGVQPRAGEENEGGAAVTRGRWRKQRRRGDRPGKRRQVAGANGEVRAAAAAPGHGSRWKSRRGRTK